MAVATVPPPSAAGPIADCKPCHQVCGTFLDISSIFPVLSA